MTKSLSFTLSYFENVGRHVLENGGYVERHLVIDFIAEHFLHTKKHGNALLVEIAQSLRDERTRRVRATRRQKKPKTIPFFLPTYFLQERVQLVRRKNEHLLLLRRVIVQRPLRLLDRPSLDWMRECFLDALLDVGRRARLYGAQTRQNVVEQVLDEFERRIVVSERRVDLSLNFFQCRYEEAAKFRRVAVVEKRRAAAAHRHADAGTPEGDPVFVAVSCACSTMVEGIGELASFFVVTNFR